MSIIDINSMTPCGLVAQYIVEMLGNGHFLSRDDYSRVEDWLSKAGTTDELLGVLDDVLPKRLEKARASGKKVFSLSSVCKTVEKRLADRRSLVGGTIHG